MKRELEVRTRCKRCAGPMFPDEDGDRFCLMCGERSYSWLNSFVDWLMEAMERQARRDQKRDHARRAAVADPPGAERRGGQPALDRQPHQ
jgi:uncharacterized Zn finger protein (UPF0148 family)